MTQPSAANPLLCNPDSGVCEIPGSEQQSTGQLPVKQVKPVRIVYFTDPICSSCWGIEPQLRKLKLEYGEDIEFEYHMGGLLPQWEGFNGGGITKPSDVSHHWDEVSLHYQMPIDGDVWLEDPLPSSFPPSIAFKAAQMQDEHKAHLFLRKVREMVFLEKKNITRWEHLSAAAQAVGLDVPRFKTDYEGTAKQRFQDDLGLARQLGVRGFPSIFVQNRTGQQQFVYGVRPYEQFEQAVLQLHPGARKATINPDPTQLFAAYATLTNREFATLAGVSPEVAAEKLTALEQQGLLRQYRTKNGSMWIWK